MNRWRRGWAPSTKEHAPLTVGDATLLTKARALALGELLDASKDAERHKRADAITDGRFSEEMKKWTR